MGAMNKQNTPKTDPVDNSSSTELFPKVGSIVRTLRKKRRMSQSELARLCDMKPTQLCNLEADKNTPSLRTLGRISSALQVPLHDLIAPATYTESASLRLSETFGERNPETSGLLRMTLETAAENAPAELFERLDALMKEYLSLEQKQGVLQISQFPFTMPIDRSERGAELLARAIRLRLGLGSTILFDVVDFLESQGVRILQTALPDGIDSLSFFDRTNFNLFVFLNENATPERQQFRLLCEIANTFLYLNNRERNGEPRVRPIVDTRANRHFAKTFAATFLMPEELIRMTCLQLNVKPEDWNWDLLLNFKQRIGVSAQSFLIRLEELNLITDEKVESLGQQIQAYYEANDWAEPAPTTRLFSRNARFNLLKLRAGN